LNLSSFAQHQLIAKKKMGRFLYWINGPITGGQSIDDWTGQCRYYRHIMKENTFGLYRWSRLFLAGVRLLDLNYYMMLAFCRNTRDERSKYSEIYVYLRGFVLFIFASNCLLRGSVWFLIVPYLIITMFFHLMAITFIGNVYKEPISPYRSLLFVLFNYIEMNLGYASMYRMWGEFVSNTSKGLIQLCPIQSIYFSFSTSATVGYGDFTVTNAPGQILVILHIFMSLCLVTVVFNYFFIDASRRFKNQKEYNK
jgi:hypothetical protein